MERTELMAWVCATDEGRAFEIWKQSFLRRNPHLKDLQDSSLVNYYQLEDSIKEWWASPMGRFNRDVLAILGRMKHFSPTLFVWQVNFWTRSGKFV